MSTIMYASNMLDMSEKYISKISNLNYQFLWGGKRKLMKKGICCLPRSQGGLNMIDLDLAIKVQRIKWVLRILQTPRNGLWKQIAIQNIKCLDSRFGIEFFAYDHRLLLFSSFLENLK